MKKILFFCIIFNCWVAFLSAMQKQPGSDMYEMIHAYCIAQGLLPITIETDERFSDGEIIPEGSDDKLQIEDKK